MLAEKISTAPETAGLVPAILRFADHENEVLRCAAIRALGAAGQNDPQIRTALLDALLDPDADVRSDAMDALAGVAGPEDAETIRRSLEGDPVREIKIAAIRRLAELGDRASVALLRALTLSRSEDRVAWEDELGDWEDWLDVQVAAIAALGQLGVEEAIEDMLTALDDEFGQPLDIPVFTALAQLGQPGVVWLLAIVKTGTGPARRRAAEALSRTAPGALADYVGELLAAEEPELRAIALDCLAADDARAAALAQEDPDPGVRRQALLRVCGDRPDLAIAAIADRDEGVQAAALGALQFPLEPEFHETLVDNMIAWLESAGAELARASARLLPVIAPDRAEAPLLALAQDPARPLDARVAAVEAVDLIDRAAILAHLVALLANPAQQVRTGALHALCRRAAGGDTVAAAALAEAIEGTLLSAETAVQSRPPEAAGNFGAPKADDSAPARIRITPEGDIVEIGEPDGDDSGGSTLAAIQASAELPQEPALAGDTPEEEGAKRRRRRAVEGPEEVADDLARVAMGLCADLGSERIGAAILTRLSDPDSALRRAAWAALARHCRRAQTSEEARAAAARALSDETADIRLAALQVLGPEGLPDQALQAALSDEDALVRIEALGALDTSQAMRYLEDRDAAVRAAVLDRVIASGRDEAAADAAERLTAAERIDTLSVALARLPVTREFVAKELATADVAPRRAYVILEALATGRAPAASA